MSKIKLFLVLAFVMVCAAGAGVGMIVDQRLRPAPAPHERHGPRGPMDELKLTSEQSQKFGDIWSEVRKLRDQGFKERREVSQKRDAQIVALLTPAQKADYDKIQDGYRASVKASEDSLQEAVRDAEKQTRAMLTPEQLPIYEKVRTRMGQPGDRGRGRGGRNRNRSTTQPATMPANTTAAAAALK